ncbi:DNA-binding protein [Acinetobacter sp. WCHAc060033]|uniref:helix-turn-helix transcriptional regulator n=1 Tax=Acinetobacter sp. WCHAc060033 TaxID=2518624 RepID=UPI001023611D|nr:helix-turn-helix domain-containing protein [Acinetobacter sp. WCHAc060033]RZG78665.1 DNA-binding protein [Acinetobacter sp. WCHAc060033]
MVLTVPQTLKLLQISRTTLYRMFASGELTKIKFGDSQRSTIRVELSEELEKKYEKQIQALII